MTKHPAKKGKVQIIITIIIRIREKRTACTYGSVQKKKKKSRRASLRKFIGPLKPGEKPPRPPLLNISRNVWEMMLHHDIVDRNILHHFFYRALSWRNPSREIAPRREFGQVRLTSRAPFFEYVVLFCGLSGWLISMQMSFMWHHSNNRVDEVGRTGKERKKKKEVLPELTFLLFRDVSLSPPCGKNYFGCSFFLPFFSLAVAVVVVAQRTTLFPAFHVWDVVPFGRRRPPSPEINMLDHIPLLLLLRKFLTSSIITLARWTTWVALFQKWEFVQVEKLLKTISLVVWSRALRTEKTTSHAGKRVSSNLSKPVFCACGSI